MYIIHIFTGYEVVIRIRKPKKDIQDTGKVKKGQRVKQRSTKYYAQKINDRATRILPKTCVNAGVLEG